MRTRLALVFSGVVVVGGCAALSAPVPREARKPPLYFPTAVGTEWIYTTGGDDEYEYTDTIVEVEDIDNAPEVTVVRFVRRKPMSTKTIRVSSDGLFLLRNSHGEHDPPACLLKLPHKPGDRWASYSLPIKPDSGYVNVAVKEERVEVPAGTFNAIRVDSEVTNDGKVEKLYARWYAPGVGVVKYASGPKCGEDGVALVLKSFKPGKK